MKIGVLGYGHFAGVVSHCLALAGHDVTAEDFAPPLFREDQKLPAQEPGWRLNYALALDEHTADADLFWIAYDVPLDATGAPVIDEILSRIKRLHEAVPSPIPFLVSCQWPVGTTRQIASDCEGREFVYVMENVRVGKAIADFQTQPCVVLGGSQWGDHSNLCGTFEHAPAWLLKDGIFGETPSMRLSWESAEFAKHSINAFLALQIAFVNELARIAPPDVNMADVTRVLKSDPRVSPLAPLTAGPAFGGGSLKRDVLVLETLKPEAPTPIIDAILVSNERR